MKRRGTYPQSAMREQQTPQGGRNLESAPETTDGLRVLHVSPSFYPAVEYGGPVASLYELCLAQRQAGLNLRVLTSTAGLSDREDGRSVAAGRWQQSFGVPTYYAKVRLPPDLAPAMLPQLIRMSRWAQVVHVTGLFSAASVLAVATALATELGHAACSSFPPRPQPAVVVSPRGALLPWALRQGRQRKQRFLSVLAPLLRQVHGWHATSEEEAQATRTILAELGALAAKVRVVAPGLAHDLRSWVSPEGRSPNSQLVVLGRVHPVKNLELALHALACLRAQVPAASLVIAGPMADPAYAAELRAKAEALGLRDAVKWPGLVTGEAKQRLLAGSAALWLCSHMESFGNVVIEALAAGTPVIATQTTPWQRLEPAAVGRWVPTDAAALAAATVELLTRQAEPSSRESLAARCQGFVRAHFSLEQSELEMRQLYRSALGSSGQDG